MVVGAATERRYVIPPEWNRSRTASRLRVIAPQARRPAELSHDPYAVRSRRNSRKSGVHRLAHAGAPSSDPTPALRSHTARPRVETSLRALRAFVVQPPPRPVDCPAHVTANAPG